MNNIHKEQILNTFYYKRPIKKTGKITYTLRRNILSIYDNLDCELKTYIRTTFENEYNNIVHLFRFLKFKLIYQVTLSVFHLIH